METASSGNDSMGSDVETASSGDARFYRSGPLPVMCCVGGEADASITAECEEMLAAQSWRRFYLTRETRARGLPDMLRRRLFAAFGEKANTITCWCSCGDVGAGGFGGEWHHDARSMLSNDGMTCEWLALYYLRPCGGENDSGHPWLEISLTSDASDAESVRANWCPIGLAQRDLILLKNEDVLHRTPRVTALTGAASRRTFAYVACSVSDRDGRPLRHLGDLSGGLEWSPVASDTGIEAMILRDLAAHEIPLPFSQYVDETAPATSEDGDEGAGWFSGMFAE